MESKKEYEFCFKACSWALRHKRLLARGKVGGLERGEPAKDQQGSGTVYQTPGKPPPTPLNSACGRRNARPAVLILRACTKARSYELSSLFCLRFSKSLFVDFFCFLVYIARDVTGFETEDESSDILTFIFVSLVEVSLNSHEWPKQNISLQYQYKYQVNKGLEERKISIRGLLVDPVTNSQN